MQNQIGFGLVLAGGAFALGLALHILLWRIRRPVAYPVWLVAIFAVSFVAAVVAAETLLGGGLGQKAIGLVSGALLYGALVSVYGLSYGGIADFSPSAEILREVGEAMPDGLNPEALQLRDLTDDWLIENRINHLLASGLLRGESDGRLQLTEQGLALVNATVSYRIALHQSHFGNG